MLAVTVEERSRVQALQMAAVLAIEAYQDPAQGEAVAP
jgi:hypothetical protein